MKLKALKVFSGSSPQGLIFYMRHDLSAFMKDLSLGFRRINISDNFEGQEIRATLEGGEEKMFQNKLGFVPSKRLILRQDVAGEIVDSTVQWSLQRFGLKNTGPDAVTITVIFMR